MTRYTGRRALERWLALLVRCRSSRVRESATSEQGQAQPGRPSRGQRRLSGHLGLRVHQFPKFSPRLVASFVFRAQHGYVATGAAAPPVASSTPGFEGTPSAFCDPTATSICMRTGGCRSAIGSCWLLLLDGGVTVAGEGVCCHHSSDDWTCQVPRRSRRGRERRLCEPIGLHASTQPLATTCRTTPVFPTGPCPQLRVAGRWPAETSTRHAKGRYLNTERGCAQAASAPAVQSMARSPIYGKWPIPFSTVSTTSTLRLVRRPKQPSVRIAAGALDVDALADAPAAHREKAAPHVVQSRDWPLRASVLSCAGLSMVRAGLSTVRAGLVGGSGVLATVSLAVGWAVEGSIWLVVRQVDLGGHRIRHRTRTGCH